MLLMSQNASVFSLVGSQSQLPPRKGSCLLAQTAHTVFPLLTSPDQYLQRRMSFWKTLVLKKSYEWLQCNRTTDLKIPLVITRKLDHFIDKKTKVQRKGEDSPKSHGQSVATGTPDSWFSPQVMNLWHILPLSILQPSCSTSPVRTFAFLAEVLLFLSGNARASHTLQKF